MFGNMIEKPLLIADILEYAGTYNSNREIVSRRVEDGGIHRYTYKDALCRTRQLANALTQLGVHEGDRIATLAWNGYRHFELYYAVSGIGAIIHTINPRLFTEQITYIINHAEDSYIFVDLSFVPLLEGLSDQLHSKKGASVKGFVVMTDREHMPETSLANVLCYEELIAAHSSDLEWPGFDERTAAALCYTSGTTGHPKGALYSHRSTVIHAMAVTRGDAMGFTPFSNVLPVVPMFHVCAWGVPYAAPMVGAGLVFPGAAMDGASLYELVDAEKTTCLLGVPTIWLNLLNHLDAINGNLDSVETVVIGGAAAPASMIEAFQEKYGVFALHAWGMTETSPMGTLCSNTPAMAKMGKQQRNTLQSKQGRPLYGIDLKIVNDNGVEQPRDGKSFGHLLASGNWVCSSYFRSDDNAAFDNDWFDTGDIATIDENGYMQIVDRSKDVIKSGGEWISSIELENIAVGHEAIAEACVIGINHPEWGERPLLLVIVKEAHDCNKQELIDYLSDKVCKWWLPDDVVFVPELPHTATGKLLKLALREQYKNHYQ